MASIKKYSEISSDWTGSAYCGLKIDWDYNNGTVDLSMYGYINAALHTYQHPIPVCAEHVPHTSNPPVYGANTQYIEETDDSPSH
jgi:endonuclease I